MNVKKTLILIILILATVLAVLAFRGSGDKTASDKISVRLFYYDPEKDLGPNGEVMCGRQGISPVTRTIEEGGDLEETIARTIKLLLEGDLTDQEKEEGLETEFPLERFALIDAELDGGDLTLKFNDPLLKTSGGSCRTGILWFQIELTAFQFEGVESVSFVPEILFQP